MFRTGELNARLGCTSPELPQLACPDLGNGPRDKRGIDPEHSIMSIVVKYSDVSRENKRHQVCGDLKVQVKQPVIGSALFLGRLNRSDGSVICRRLSFETAPISCFAIPADEWPSIRKS